MYPSPQVPGHIVAHNRGYGFGVAAASGLIPAAIAANSLLFALYCAQQSAVVTASQRIAMSLDRLRVAFTCIGAFTTPVTAARGLGIYRATPGSGHALPTGGVALTVAKKDSAAGTSVASAMIANAAVLTPGTVVISGGPIAMLDLASVGAAGNRQEMVFELAAPYNAPITLQPDDMLVIANPTAMDAAGTWQLTVPECHWIEATIAAIS